MPPLKQITEAQNSEQLNNSKVKPSLYSVSLKTSAPAVTSLTACLISWVWICPEIHSVTQHGANRKDLSDWCSLIILKFKEFKETLWGEI